MQVKRTNRQKSAETSPMLLYPYVTNPNQLCAYMMITLSTEMHDGREIYSIRELNILFNFFEKTPYLSMEIDQIHTTDIVCCYSKLYLPQILLKFCKLKEGTV